jgi:membrane-bound serine protease (ClpP class)
MKIPKLILTTLTLICAVVTMAASDDTTSVVYRLPIFSNINSTTWIHTQRGFEEAEEINAEAILVHLNTYGGEVVFADSIRTKILNSRIPVYVFIDNNAASAGALISIAANTGSTGGVLNIEPFSI